MGSLAPQNSPRAARRAAGGVCRYSPDSPEAKLSCHRPSARQSPTGEPVMKTKVLAVAVCLIVPFTFAAAQQSSCQQGEKTKNLEAMCPMHDAIHTVRDIRPS